MPEKTTILIVDDDTSMSRSMALVLKLKGYEVTTVSSGAEGIETVKAHAFDMIFMDIKMPLMNGVEAFEKIREIRPDAVVMMMTAYALEELIQKALEKGAYGVIHKPLDIETMLVTIEEVKKRDEGMLILVVDDEPGITTSLKNILVKKGHRVATASSGEEAIELAKVKEYDILFIDMKLPAINGLQTYIEIRKIHPETIAVIITGYRQEMADLVDTALQKNAYAVLYKPFDMEALITIVNEIEKKRKMCRGSEGS